MIFPSKSYFDIHNFMSKPVLINPHNALEFLAFVVVLGQNITQEDDKNLRSLELKLKDDLPNFSQHLEFETEIDNGQIISQKTKNVRVLLRDDNSKPSWEVSVNKNQIVVRCFSCNNWKFIFPKALGFIQSAIDILESSSRNISSLSIQCVDKFTQSNVIEYTQFDIFKNNTEYLTQKSRDVGKLWHVHQGWFDKDSNDSKILNILNIGTIENENSLITAIDHLSQYLLKIPKPLLEKDLNKIFCELHDNNKSLIRDLLNEKQIKAIGLNNVI